VRRGAALLVFGVGALLLLTPRAPGLPDVPGDPTPPVITPVITGTLGDAGWYRSNVTLNWTVVDPESIILSTTGCDARTLTADIPATQFACSAESDGGETRVAKTFKLDKTPPTATPSPSPGPNPQGWHRAPFTVGFVGSDAMSGPDQPSCTARIYSGPDTQGETISGTCKDRAGNESNPATYKVKYDVTPPSNQGGSASRSPDANGWYNHALAVTFQGSDATSAPTACTQTTYSEPDRADATVSGTCRDQAGNESVSKTVQFKYDATAPQVTGATPPPDPSGWYTRPVVFGFRGSDGLSGIDTCPAVTYDGPDGADASVTGACLDKAGNLGTRSFPLKYDDTGPAVTPTAGRGPDANGWYNHSLSVSFTGSDTA
jgi:hypothetical protein